MVTVAGILLCNLFIILPAEPYLGVGVAMYCFSIQIHRQIFIYQFPERTGTQVLQQPEVCLLVCLAISEQSVQKTALVS